MNCKNLISREHVDSSLAQGTSKKPFETKYKSETLKLDFSAINDHLKNNVTHCKKVNDYRRCNNMKKTQCINISRLRMGVYNYFCLFARLGTFMIFPRSCTKQESNQNH